MVVSVDENSIWSVAIGEAGASRVLPLRRNFPGWAVK